ncbi:hypothetical protein [Actinopolyspora saharensis]|uniref:Uncharacterized protein n=1 Tax=Actinopolyspora saharensis TaxID=995062 RepID=A0A1H0ZDJ5_9ACTN|nr:hypothetical protein [Actinopolyspora saharensis]SDQ25231.1 hypothetical protein SAMN04489718_0971 [Actinopolyspora saharensis]
MPNEDAVQAIPSSPSSRGGGIGQDFGAAFVRDRHHDTETGNPAVLRSARNTREHAPTTPPQAASPVPRTPARPATACSRAARAARNT